MTEKGFNDLGLRSQKDILEGFFRYLNDAYEELSRRGYDTGDFYTPLLGFSIEGRVWVVLWEGGGAQRFNNIATAVGCSHSTLIKVLNSLIYVDRVRAVGEGYQAICPAWLVHFPEPNRRMV